MKNLITVSYLFLVFAFIYSCKSSREDSYERIQNLEKSLAKDSNVVKARHGAYDLYMAYKGFCDSFPEDKHISDCLYRAGELATSVGMFPDAIVYYQKFYDKFPTHKKAPMSLFLQGYLYETGVKNLDKAKELYSAFLKKYPTNELVPSVQFSLDNMGKSDAEIGKMLEEKEKEFNKKK